MVRVLLHDLETGEIQTYHSDIVVLLSREEQVLTVCARGVVDNEELCEVLGAAQAHLELLDEERELLN